MSKISEIVKVSSGYANFVQLRSALREEAENSGRMAMYRPTKAHRNALERISRGLHMPNDKKFYLLSGSYGTGKSHLCLMLANVLSKSSDDPSLKGFYENYAKLDDEKAKLLKNVRKGGQFLVALCDYGSGRKFEDEVLRAIVEACEERGIDVAKFTEFDEADRKLAEWELAAVEGRGVRNFYADFIKALEKVAPGTPIAALRAGLKNFKRDAMTQFHAAHQLAQGDEFKAKSGNLVSIVRSLVRSEEFKSKFKGMAIFFDEFGTAVLQNARYDTPVMQSFMEDICQHEANVVFVGCIHKSFKDYAERTNQTTASVMDARITQVPLANEGIEEIIGAIVETEKAGEIWRNEVKPKEGVLDKLTPECVSLKLFPWITDTARIRERVLEDIYGMHPMALSCLLKLSSEIGSDVRSTFTFFSGGGAISEPGSYAEFIAKNEIAGANGALRMYLVDQLFTFFEKELSPSSRELLDSQRTQVNGYATSLQALRKSVKEELFDEPGDERTALLRTILVYSLCSISATLENIQFGRYALSAAEKTAVKKLLGELEKAGALYLRKTSSTYELCASDGQDPVMLVDNLADSEEIQKSATVAELLKQSGSDEEYLIANGWNLAFTEDKKLKRTLVRGRELGPELWSRLEQEAAKAGAKFATSYEGHAVYALCEDEGEVKLAREAVKTIPAGNILVAVPHEPIPFREDLHRVIACRHLISPAEAEKHPAQTTARIRDMLDDGVDDGYLPNIKKVVNAVWSGAQASWFEEAGKLLIEKPLQAYKPADMLCERLFSERCQIKHPDLNLIHDEKWMRNSNTALKQAVEELLDTDSTVQIDNGSTANHGEKRYLQNVLLTGCGALSRLRTNGPVAEFTVESDPAKIDAKLPALKKLITRLSSLGPKQSLVLGDYLREMRAAPYGAGGTMLVLAIAHAVRAFGERMRIFSDSTHTEAGDLSSYDAIVRAVSDNSCRLELAVREITVPQRAFIEAVAKAVGAPALAQGEVRTVADAYEALRTWWKDVPSVAKVADLHPAGDRLRLGHLKQLLDTQHGDSFELMLQRLAEVYAGEPVDVMSEADAKNWSAGFASDVKSLNAGLTTAQREIAAAILEVYGNKGDMVECEKTINEWYEALTSDQRDPLRCEEHDDAQRLLTILSDSSKSLEQKLMNALPQSWGLGPVKNWTSLQTTAYKAKWEQSKSVIESIKPLVPDPEISLTYNVTKIQNNIWEIEDDAKIRITIPKGAKSVIYSLGNESPEEALAKITLMEATEVPVNLDGEASGEMRIYAVDEEGNTSRKCTYRIRHKQKQHHVQVVSEDLFGDKGSFKFPDSVPSFLEVIRSLTDKALERGVIQQDVATKIKNHLEELKP
jgi:hypothetical protein